jgi:hypothetical protein
MKLSTYHKRRGDRVSFFKGSNKTYSDRFGDARWDRVYISTIFTFHYNHSLHAIDLAKKHADSKDIYVGGVATTLLRQHYADLGISVVQGLLDVKGKLGLRGDSGIDDLIPDYSILDEIGYKYPVIDAYIGYATRGCVNKCPFCAVPLLEPKFIDYFDLKKYVNSIEKEYGEKRNLLLLDNNVLASRRFDRIIKDILSLGFEKDATTSKGIRRYVDFNQGLDARLVNEKNVALLAKIAINPARVAFDHVELAELYSDKIRLLAKHDVVHLSNFLLFNFKDHPYDLYERIMINIRLNEELGARIFSFPMKYVPLDSMDRSYVGKYWTKKQLRAIQVILNATHGVVGPHRPFVGRAFGKNIVEFETLLWMPEEYLMYREKNEKSRAADWREEFLDLTDEESRALKEIIRDNRINNSVLKLKANSRVKGVLKHYRLMKKQSQGKLDDF